MQTLARTVFTGKWRSFKIFKNSGGIRLNTEKQFKEFDFDADGTLTVTAHEGNHVDKVVQTNLWSISFKDKKHFLDISELKILYEVITINHTVMVLSDNIYNEKTFFAKENIWQEYLRTNHMVLM
jgi:hypothetical protein